MRWRILVTLVHKEALRHVANRGGLALAALLVLASVVLALQSKGPVLAGGVECCFIDYWHDGPWIEHLRRNVPPELDSQIKFRAVASVAAAGETIYYPAGAGAIQIRAACAAARSSPCKVWVWYPGDAAGLAVFEAWFWKESARFFRHQAASQAGREGTAAPAPPLEEERSQLQGPADARTTAATALVLFALFFPCVYLLPSWTCEERERGLLLAQALSPASPLEILAARALFYGAIGTALAAAVTAAGWPAALGRGFYWLALLVAALGAVGVGSTIACLAGTQRRAGLGALGYMLAVALLLSACRWLGLPAASWFVLESHTPPILHAALRGTVQAPHWVHLAAVAALALAWVALAAALFRRRGWQ
jgi:hypothetical protein